jgi:ribose transport system substrate-binding protein
VVNAWLAKYPDQVKGIFAANDDMAVGAAEALRSKGLNGKIPVTGSDGSADMLALVESGDALSTMQNDAFGQGAYATAIAYASLVGDIDAESLPHAQRDFFLKTTFVTSANVDQAAAVTANFDPAKYRYDTLKADLWGDVAGPIDDATWIPQITL